MKSNQNSTQKLKLLRSIFCPQKAKFIVAEISNQFVVPNGQAAWVQCEACQGWHVLIDNWPTEEVTPQNSLLPGYETADSSFYQTPLL